MIAKTELVRCVLHGASCCWVQLDGSHLSWKVCKCSHDIPAYLCPIDGHAIRFLVSHPEWIEVRP
jgi:hypothetical protein